MLMHQLLIGAAEPLTDKPAFRWADRGGSLTYAQAVDAMNHVAGTLRSLGVRPGDRLSVVAPERLGRQPAEHD